MAAFSTLALIGLGAALGGTAAATLGKRRKPAQDGSVAGSRQNPANLLPSGQTREDITPPPSAVQSSSTAMVEARQASLRQRRRAAAGGQPSAKTTRRAPAARLEPRMLGAGFLGG